MGYLYGTPTGTKVNAAGVLAALAERAMWLGATSFTVSVVSDGVMTEGSSFGIGVGGGASLLSKGDSIAVAPNGGLGYGKAKSYSEELPTIVIKLYFDKDYLVIDKDVEVEQEGR